MKPRLVVGGTLALTALAAYLDCFPGSGAGAVAPARAQEAPPPEAPPAPSTLDIESALEQGRALVAASRYEEAIAILDSVLQATLSDPQQRRAAYLLIVEAHVYEGNRCAVGSKEQQLWYEEARKLIRECLGVRDLRHTRPEPPERYPVEMLQFFAVVRQDMFGSLEIAPIDPSGSEVILDGEALRPAEDGFWREEDVPIGTHVLAIRHPQCETITEEIEIGPATRVTRSYALHRRRGLRWYATRAGVPAVAVIGLVAGLLAGGDEGSVPLEPLPEPPPPPGR